MNKPTDQSDGQSSAKKGRRSWVILLIVAFCLVVMNARGIREHQPGSSIRAMLIRLGPTTAWRHGWPFRWLDSEVPTSPAAKNSVLASLASNAIPASKLQLNSTPRSEPKSLWPSSTTAAKVHWMPLLLNIVVAISILLVVYLVCRLRGQRGFKFSLLEIGSLVLLMSICMAHFEHHRSVSRQEREVDLSEFGNHGMKSHEWYGPSWLRALVGEAEWMKDYWHVDEFTIDGNSSHANFNALKNFQYATQVRIEGDPTLSQIESLAALGQLKKIVVDGSLRFSFTTLLNKKSLGVYDDATRIVKQRQGIDNAGEQQVLRLGKPQVQFPSVAELQIDGTGMFQNRWPRALDLVEICPNLKRISIKGNQFIVDDVMRLPANIEEIELGFPISDNEALKLRAKYPRASIQLMPSDMSSIAGSMNWRAAKVRVNRRRKYGWSESRFGSGVLDLSSTHVDRAFLETLNPIFDETNQIVFGSFDHADTAIWLAEQCPNAVLMNASSCEFEFEELSRFPRSFELLFIKQGSMTAQQLAALIQSHELESLMVLSSDFNDEEVQLLKSASPACRIRVKRSPKRVRLRKELHDGITN